MNFSHVAGYHHGAFGVPPYSILFVLISSMLVLNVLYRSTNPCTTPTREIAIITCTIDKLK